MAAIDDVSGRPGMYEIDEVPKACPRCASAASVVYKTRRYELLLRVVRYRQCRACDHRYTTTTDKT